MPIVIAIVLVFAYFAHRGKEDENKEKAETLPPCPGCGNKAGWTVLNRYLHQRWFGTPVNTYLSVRCPQCNLNAKLFFNNPGWGNWGHKGWMFE